MNTTFGGYVKFVRGTPAAWEKLKDPQNDTLYFISETNATTGVLYLGSKLICGGGEITITNSSLGQLLDVGLTGEIPVNSVLVYEGNKWVNKSFSTLIEEVPFTGLSLSKLDDVELDEEIPKNSYLVYNGEKWVNQSEDAFNMMVGSTEHEDGRSGLVPAPKKTPLKTYLDNTGNWSSPLDAILTKDDYIPSESAAPRTIREIVRIELQRPKQDIADTQSKIINIQNNISNINDILAWQNIIEGGK